MMRASRKVAKSELVSELLTRLPWFSEARLEGHVAELALLKSTLFVLLFGLADNKRDWCWDWANGGEGLNSCCLALPKNTFWWWALLPPVDWAMPSVPPPPPLPPITAPPLIIWDWPELALNMPPPLALLEDEAAVEIVVADDAKIEDKLLSEFE